MALAWYHERSTTQLNPSTNPLTPYFDGYNPPLVDEIAFVMKSGFTGSYGFVFPVVCIHNFPIMTEERTFRLYNRFVLSF